MLLFVLQDQGREYFGIQINGMYYVMPFATAVFNYKNLTAAEIMSRELGVIRDHLNGTVTYIDLIDEV